jgi:hypothetical protein
MPIGETSLGEEVLNVDRQVWHAVDGELREADELMRAAKERDSMLRHEIC